MKRAEKIVILALLLVSAAVSFSIARMTAMAQEDPSHRWLNSLSDDTIELEKQFDAKYGHLAQALVDEQKSLAAILVDVSAPDKAIIDQVETVSRAREKLMRSATEHLIKVHRHLPLPQRELLMQFCAESLRGDSNALDGSRAAYCDSCGHTCGLPCPGSCSLKGGLECCKSCTNTACPARGKGFAQILMLSDRQLETMKQHDPAFAADSKILRRQLLQQRSKLLAMFEDSETKDHDLMQEVDRMIAAHNAIE